MGRDTTGFMALKYNAGFALQWRAVFPALGGALRAVVDPTGNLVMTGAVSTGSGGFGATVMVYNWLTLKVSPAGALLWSASHGQPGGLSTEPRALAVAGDGTVYLTGRGSEPVVDATTGVQTYRTALVTLRYTGAGVLAGSHYVPTHQAGRDLQPQRRRPGGAGFAQHPQRHHRTAAALHTAQPGAGGGGQRQPERGHRTAERGVQRGGFGRCRRRHRQLRLELRRRPERQRGQPGARVRRRQLPRHPDGDRQPRRHRHGRAHPDHGQPGGSPAAPPGEPDPVRSGGVGRWHQQSAP